MFTIQPVSLMLFLVFLVNLTVMAVSPPTDIGDSIAAIQSAAVLLECLKTGADTCPGMAQFGPSIYFIPILTQIFELSLEDGLNTLAWVSLLSYVLMLLIITKMKSGLSNYYNLVLFGFMVGLPLAYAKTTFSESVSTLALILILLGRYKNAPFLYFLGFLFSSGTRESGIVLSILILIILEKYFCHQEEIEKSPKRLFSGLFGITVGAFTLFALNLYRWTTFTNPIYTNDSYYITRPTTFVSSLVGLVFSFNGGLVFFWPITILVFFLSLRLIKNGKLFEAIVSLSPLLVIIFICSLWFSPFGWYAWGPRLVFPIAAFTILLMALTADPRLKPWKKKSDYSWLSLMAWLQVIAGTVTLNRFIATNDFFSSFFAPGKFCPNLTLEQSPKFMIENCLIRMTWEIENSIFFDGLREFLSFSYNSRQILIILYFVLLSSVAFAITKTGKKDR